MAITISGSTDTISAADGSLTIAGTQNVDQVTVGTGASVGSPATNVLTLGTNDTERLRITSTGNVGIGTVPQSWSGFRSFQLGGTTSIWSVEGGQAGSSFYSNNIYYDGSNRRYLTDNSASEYVQDASTGNHIFYEASSGTAGNTLSGYTEIARFTSNGLKVPSGLGIDFSATGEGSGTMTSELLDDYEEGTFTPSFTGGTSGSGYTRQVGEYTKVGRLVTFTLTIDGDGLTGTATAIEIGGLPFTHRNVPENGGAQYTYPGNFDTTNDRRFWLVAQNNTTLSYRSATAANINGNLVNNVNSSFVLYGHYFTDS